ncbi:uncharacterized protein [Leptinotarsa decemlineata]|uniref:uncharacterized protein n=1 Tax=Leptinotarsa decemlineata TaxID=7539 RepID=UPI003D309646
MSRGKYLVSLATDNRTEVLAQDLTTPDSRTLANEVQNKEEIDEPIIIQTTTTEAFSYETASYHRELLQTSAKNAQNDEEIGEITGYSDDSIVDPNYQQSESSEDNTSCEANEHENMNNEIICTRKKRRLRKNSERRERDKNSHQLRSPCACKKRCVEKINEQRRVAIWNEFYKMDYNTRRSWVHGRIEQKGKARSTTKVEVRKRSRSLMYTLPDENAHSQTICKKFFLRTLGYDEKNDKFITTVFKNLAPDSITPNRDRRGLAAPKNKCNREILQQHISSFHPCISHYRREHAPNRLYLPHDITIRSMHADYLQKFPQNKISYYTYRKVVSDMNISFTKLGNEECDHCMMQIQHIKSHNEATATVVEVDENLKNAEGSNEYETTQRNSTGKTATTDLNLSALESSTTKFRASCTTCMKWLQHIEFAKLRRVEYRKDVARKKIETEAVRSVDLQKNCKEGTSDYNSANVNTPPSGQYPKGGQAMLLGDPELHGSVAAEDLFTATGKKWGYPENVNYIQTATIEEYDDNKDEDDDGNGFTKETDNCNEVDVHSEAGLKMDYTKYQLFVHYKKPASSTNHPPKGPDRVKLGYYRPPGKNTDTPSRIELHLSENYSLLGNFDTEENRLEDFAEYCVDKNDNPDIDEIAKIVQEIDELANEEVEKHQSREESQPENYHIGHFQLA